MIVVHGLFKAVGGSNRFTNFPAYNTHIYRKHRSELGLPGATYPINDPEPTVSEQAREENHFWDHSAVDNSGVFDNFSVSAGDSDDDTSNRAHPESSHDNTETNARLLLRLSEGRKLSEVAIQDVIEGCQSVYSDRPKRHSCSYSQ